MLEIVANYHCTQFQGKCMVQIQENGKKPHFRSDLGPLNPNSGCQISLSKHFTATYFLLPIPKEMQLIYFQ